MKSTILRKLSPVVLVLVAGLGFVFHGEASILLQSGQMVEGTLPSDTAETWFVNAHAGDSIVAQVSETDLNHNFNIRVKIYSPGGALLVAGEVGYASQASTRASIDGTYQVTVNDLNHNPDFRDTYRLCVAVVPESANQFSRLLSNGVNHHGSLIRGAMDIWKFDVTVGDSIVASVAKESGETSFFARLQLYDEAGNKVSGVATRQANQVEYRATKSGAYTIIVSDGNSDPYHTGNYALRLVRVPDIAIQIPSGDDGGVLGNSALYPGLIQRGRIEPGDLDSWTFYATKGDNLHITINEVILDSAFAPWIRLYEPSGARLDSDYGNSLPASLSSQAPSTGLYTVVVANHSLGGPPLYNVYQLTLTGNTFSVPGSPQVRLSREGNTLVLSWSADFTGWSVQRSDSLGVPNWSTVVGQPSISNNQWVLPVSGSGQSGFYRLVR